ncbi:DcaP family trimeric outer membrane transporter [Thiohalorhabdus methylotrophus]|uniref:DcaP family trimeric outer membrane transporter n=1 Tax=Thiohalorhabdus methylotrophus TaxID=3242694 RepID=A0ABV4TV57_9GAMM
MDIRFPVLGLAALLPLTAQAAATEVHVSGFIKLDALATQYSAGAPDNPLMEEFLVPSLIPTGDDNRQARFSTHARESRVRFTTETDLHGHTLRSHLEMDFQVTDVPGSDERISNSNAPRLRHAFFTFDHFLFGQTWSTFYNVSSLPELNDFVGPVGSLFNRQPQVRYSVDAGYGTWHFAVENSETSLNDNAARVGGADADNERITANAGNAPDLALRYELRTAGGSNLSLAFLGRQLAYEKADGDLETAFGGGVSLAGRIKAGTADDFRFMVNYGHLGRYLGLNAFAGGFIEDADGSITPIPVRGALAAYRHFWAEGLRSTVSASLAEADVKQGEVGGAEAERYTSAHVNLMYSPVDPATFGIEYSRARRTNLDDSDGTMDRIQISAKYAF